ncbi:hypothetical protein HPB48_021437 [Haemaphysalis longicornis]|uniref:Cuticle protein n=1 Tax=Haemaphysalis longicornis TaxID=44386 RepID=A0A9J6FZK7_HAELO|nr:hypothetical protein HPB48_021437 [Haemaphysalis longicornis]
MGPNSASFCSRLAPPQPYSFGYDNVDEFGTQTYHKEQSDASNTKTGSYGYRDAYGIFRRVNYIADVNGFRATIDTNEPGTAPGRSADAVFNANPVAAPVAAKSASASASAVGSGCRLPACTSPPQPYSFGYDNTDEFGTQTYHKEQGDASNTKTGSYGYRDAYGIFRRVNYIADVNGFRATIDTNEPGTAPGRSADAVFNANPVAAPVAANLHSRTALATTNTDEFGTQTYHKEQGDASNTKTGSYGYRDEYGIFRRVNYVADANGFRATIDTNEPGTAPGRSADAVFNANPVAAPVRAKSASAPLPTYVAAPVFGYDNTDEFGTQTYHKEQGDASNTKRGSYGYRDEYGIFRRVNYVADANGFRATIDTNEPGTAAGRSADAVFNANPVAAPVRAKSASAPFPIYVPARAYGSGYTAPGGVAPWAG